MSSLTSEKILDASIALFSQKGYNDVTTKEIAKQARVSEMTLFRHFKCKRVLFAAAFEKYVFSPVFRSVFEDSLEWDLEKDLLKISLSYQDTLTRNQKIILMQFKNNQLTPESDVVLSKFSQELIKLVTAYLTKMRSQGALKGNPEVIAVSFLAANFGFFMAYLMNEELVKNTELLTCISDFVKTLARGLSA